MARISRLERLSQLRLAHEGNPVYDRDIHPGIVMRGLLAGITPDRIAHQIGITLEELQRWIDEFPEMREAAAKGAEADGHVVQSLFELATGWRDPLTGKRHPPNVAAAIFWAKARLGMSDQVAQQAPPPTPEDMTHEELLSRAQDLLNAAKRARPGVIDVTPEGEE